MGNGGRIVAVAVAAWLVCVNAPAIAQEAEASSDEARAKELYAEGTRLYAEGRYVDAIARFEASFELSSRPLLLYNLSLAYEHIGEYDKAIENLRGYVASAPAEEQETIRKKLHNLKKLADESRAERERAVVEQATPGESRVEVQRGVPIPSLLSISVMSAGGVLLLGSMVTGILALNARSEVDELCTSGGDKRLCRSEARGPIDRDQGLSIAADVTLALGITAVAAGAVLWLWQPKTSESSSSEQGPSVSVVPVPGGVQVGITGSY